MNTALSAFQNNTKRGPIGAIAGVDLSTKEGFLVKLGSSSGVRQALLPTALTDAAIFSVLKPAASGSEVTIECPSPEENFRAVAKGTGSAGALLSLADPATPADAGKLRVVPSTSGSTFHVLAVAEEDFVDGQHVLCRPFFRTVINP